MHKSSRACRPSIAVDTQAPWPRLPALAVRSLPQQVQRAYRYSFIPLFSVRHGQQAFTVEREWSRVFGLEKSAEEERGSIPACGQVNRDCKQALRDRCIRVNSIGQSRKAGSFPVACPPYQLAL